MVNVWNWMNKLINTVDFIFVRSATNFAIKQHFLILNKIFLINLTQNYMPQSTEFERLFLRR